jgi:hypothetical protein
MSTDVLATLQGYLIDGGKAISITPAIGGAFGAGLGTAIQQLLSGSLQVGGVSFSLTGGQATATVGGTGSAPPLLSNFQVSAVFTAQASGVQLALSATFQSSWPVSNAWPALNQSPFTDLTLSSGSLALTVNPGDQSFDLTASATASLEGSPLGTGLLVVSYGGGTLGFLGGFIVTSGTGNWTPFKHWPVLQSLSLTGEAGAFLSTITQTDLSAFKSLKLPYLPKQIAPGLTFLASMTLGGDLEKLGEVLPAGTTLTLLANLPLSEPLSGASVTASLTAPATNSAFSFTQFSLAWKSTSPTSGSIGLTVAATFNISKTESLTLTADGEFDYGPTPSLSIDLTVTGTGSWTHPFGIPNLTILSFSIGISLSEEGVNLALAGQIAIGTDPGQQVILELGGGIEDFEVPSYVEASLSAADKGKSVTLAQLVTDFIPSLNLTNFPLLNNISFAELSFLAVAAPVTILGKSYQPGIGATGDITFYGYNLDFAFSLTTSPQTAVMAKGSISHGGGPIVVNAGGINLITLSDVTGAAGPSACIDTTASGFCGSGTGGGNYYFNINAKVQLLGLVSASVLAQATKDSFEFDLALGASGVFSEHLHCLFDPSGGNFAASAVMTFSPPYITLGPWGPIPRFTIPTPQINFCLALGTVAPSAAPCDDGWMPPSTPYFYFHLSFEWGVISFDVSTELDLASVATAFSDFEQFLVNWLENNAKAVLQQILDEGLKIAAELLRQIGMAFNDIVNALANFFGEAINEVAQIVTDVFQAAEKACGVVTGNAALPSSSLAAAEVPVATREGWGLALSDLTRSADGQKLLYHYYLHRGELERRLQSGDRLAGTLARYRALPEPASARPVSLAIDLIYATAAEGGEEYQASAAEVVRLLQPHRDLTYPELLRALGG